MPKTQKYQMSSDGKAKFVKPEFDAEEVFRRRPDFFEKHLKGAPNLRAVMALMRKNGDK